MTLTISSPAFNHDDAIPAQYTCEGRGTSPALVWSGVPTGTQSLALIVDDPDAPDPAAPKMTWVHWMLYNLPPDSTGLPESVAANALPAGTRDGLNDWKRTGYGGPCPPIGRHRYFHKLYALDAVLPDLGRPTKAQLERPMREANGMNRLVYKIPTRGLLGYRSEFMTATKGLGMMNYVFAEYGPYAGDIVNRTNGVLISMETCVTVAYALFNLQERGRLFLGPGIKIYKGQIIGENSRNQDMVVNPAKGKKLTNMRASGSDENVILTPPVNMSLEDCIAYINDDELVEVTPKSIRLRKRG